MQFSNIYMIFWKSQIFVCLLSLCNIRLSMLRRTSRDSSWKERSNVAVFVIFQTFFIFNHNFLSIYDHFFIIAWPYACPPHRTRVPKVQKRRRKRLLTTQKKWKKLSTLTIKLDCADTPRPSPANGCPATNQKLWYKSWPQLAFSLRNAFRYFGPKGRISYYLKRSIVVPFPVLTKIWECSEADN